MLDESKPSLLLQKVEMLSIHVFDNFWLFVRAKMTSQTPC